MQAVIKNLFFVLVALLSLTACSVFSRDATSTSDAPSNTSPLPTPSIVRGISSSPVTTNSLSPLPSDAIPEKYRFSINDDLLVAGASVVEGTGPPGTGIIIVDVTLVGERLGDGFIQEDGTFTIQINPPLVSQHFIGIQVGIPAGQEVGPDYLQQFTPYAGDDASDMMMIGTLWDTAEVQDNN